MSLFIAAVFLALAQQPRSAPPLAITHVTVIDVAAGASRTDQTVLIEGNRIRAVGRAASVKVPSGARVIEAQGKYLIPGLWDMHVHLGSTGREALEALIANGVTGVRDMGGKFDLVRAWRDSVAAGTLVGPRIEMTGPIIENGSWLRMVLRVANQRADTGLASGMAERIAVTTEEDARRAIARIAALGVTLVKVRNSPPPAAYFTLLREARRRGLRVVGHAPNPPITLAEASDSGQASLEHQLLGMRGYQWVSLLDTLTPQARADLFQRFARNHTALTPTIIAGIGFRRTPDSVALALIDDSLGVRDSRRRTISRRPAADWRRQILMKADEGPQPDWDSLGRQAVAHIRALDSAGVLILAGTDLATALVYPGFAIHDELALLVREGGLSPARALKTATINPAIFFDLEGTMGTVSPGASADLVLLDGDPLKDIANVSRVHRVVVQGRVFEGRER